MIRQCCMHDCKRPNGVYGCTFAGYARACDDCMRENNALYRACLFRQMVPLPGMVTHGLCPECFQKARVRLASLRALRRLTVDAPIDSNRQHSASL